MSGFDNMTEDEIAAIVAVIADLEAENARLTIENEALKLWVRDLEFNIGWRDGHREARAYGLGAGGSL